MNGVYDPKIYHEIVLKLDKYTLQEILTLNLYVEDKILELVDQLFFEILLKFGVSALDQEYLTDSKKKTYRYSMQLDTIKRNYHIDIRNMVSLQSDKQYSINKVIDGFGKVKSISISTPFNLSKFADFISKKIYMFLISSYAALEFVFISKIDDLDYKVFNKLYDSINQDLDANGKEYLKNKFWFGVHADNDGLYFFDKPVMIDLIKKYKENQVNYNSPYELISYIITEPVPTDKSIAKDSLNSKKDLTKKFSDTVYQTKAPNTYSSEKIMFDSDYLSIYALMETRGFMLAVGYPSENSTEFKYIFDRNIETLKYIFEDGMKDWSPFMLKIRNIHSSNKDSIINSDSGEFLGGLLGAFISSISK